MKKWQIKLINLEQKKHWPEALALLQERINREPQNKYPYIYIQFLIMNLIVEEPHGPELDLKFYQKLGLQYFTQAYAKFSDDPEYLFLTGITAFMSVWLWNIETDDAQAMLDAAFKAQPDNKLYQWTYYGTLRAQRPKDRKKAMGYAREALKDESFISQTLKQHGAIGSYLLGIIQSWAKDVVGGYGYIEEPINA